MALTSPDDYPGVLFPGDRFVLDVLVCCLLSPSITEVRWDHALRSGEARLSDVTLSV